MCIFTIKIQLTFNFSLYLTCGRLVCLHDVTLVVHVKLFEPYVDLWKTYFLLILTRWSTDKFPKEKPLVFYKAGEPILPLLDMQDGFKFVLKNMVSYIQRKVPIRTLKLWRLQSPRHFYGGDWNQNGSCLFDKPLEESQVQIKTKLPMLPCRHLKFVLVNCPIFVSFKCTETS